MKLLAAIFPAFLALLVAAQNFNDVTLEIINTDLAPDGFTRSTVSANGTFPGPIIRATKGDTLRVTVNNQLTDPTMRRSTTLDFDGIFFDSSNVYNEGTPFVTTCPFGPNASYTYVLPLGNQTGSYWYHSQLSLQYADGLRGALIIYDPDDPQADLYDVDDDSTIWFLGDWWHNASIAMLESYQATQIIPVADSGLFNGAGRFNTGPLTEYAVSTVTSGTRYRMRIINASARSDFTVSVDNHTMTVIGADGVATEPHTVTEMLIHAGQRYDIVLTADQPVGNYWINTILSGGNAAHNLNLNATLGRGILRYEGAPNAEPTTPMTLGPADPIILNEWELTPLDPVPVPPFDVELSFVTSMTANASSPSGFNSQWNINNVSYVSPVVPTLLKVLGGATSADDFNVTENTFVIPANKVVQINFVPDPNNELHPFHLHGGNFWVIKSNGSDIVNEVNPIRRDVAAAASGGTILRFTTDHAGPWFFHCHIFFHMNAGLASVIAQGLNETRTDVHPTEAWDNLCDAYYALPC
ncbi:Laccase 2 [Mycena sanguinolenta]|uniref:Laccase 2 n=1 Tax=Mycena sanguinolenta TaxID=230812 RepID=A0A8H6Z4H1_9AGAR|nr:Laccase 2 [Mycena sanguinolenta]